MSFLPEIFAAGNLDAFLEMTKIDRDNLTLRKIKAIKALMPHETLCLAFRFCNRSLSRGQLRFLFNDNDAAIEDALDRLESLGLRWDHRLSEFVRWNGITPTAFEE
jgi:hypothetical protein